MAKKKENELTYLQSPIPQGQKYYKSTKLSFSGLNRRHTLDTGVLSYEKNISTVEAPYLTPSPMPSKIRAYSDILDIFGFDDYVVVLYKTEGKLAVDYLDNKGLFASGVLSTTDITSHRSIVQFNVYDTPTDVLGGEYVKKLLIFPDKKSIDLNVTRNYEAPTLLEFAFLETDTLKIPTLKYATVHLSRVFGVADDRVYASGFNDYANWNLDTADEYNESNAWCSPAQANVKADSKFTGITTYQNHVVCFKRNFMHEIYNTKNPFRIQDIYAEGTIDNRTIQDVDGRLIFVSDDNVKIYTGSNPKIISYNLNISRYENAISGQDGRNYYLFVKNATESHFFVYDTMIDEWSERDLSEYSEIRGFANNSQGVYMATFDGIYKLNTSDYTEQKWAFETDLMTNRTVDIKHIKKLQMLGDFNNCDLDVYILYDDEEFNAETSHKVYSRVDLVGRKPIRVKPRMTAHYGFKLHFEGVGYAKLYELEMFAQQGGELYV
jgi:hypothetical protein